MSIRSEITALEVELTVASEGLVLRGRLRFFATRTPVAAVIIHPGSGPTDRDGNSRTGLNTDCYKQLAECIALRNIAVLCIDKRGVGQSKSAEISEEQLSIDDYATDLLRWQNWLKTRCEVPVYLIGHSEGALIAMLAARQTQSTAAIILLCATSTRLHLLLLEQYQKNSPAIAVSARRIIDRLLAGHTNIECPPELMTALRPSVQPYMASVMKYDPCQVISELRLPCLIVSGSHDVQVEAEDTQRLVEGAYMADYTCIEGMGHTLKMAHQATDSHDSYRDPSMPVSTELVERICQFINANTG